MIEANLMQSQHYVHAPAGPARKLSGKIVPRQILSDTERQELFSLFDSYYLGTSKSQFFADLDTKQQVMQLRSSDGVLVGFSTLDEWITEHRNERIRIFFSGDTIIAPAFWGTPEMPRLWTRYMFTQADDNPGVRAFWFLISSGYKTYRLLPLFFRAFCPKRLNNAPEELPALLSHLAKSKFNEQYVAEQGVVRLRNPTPLRPGVADAPTDRNHNPDIRFFLERNPGHRAGDELACLAELSRDNLTAAGQRMLGERHGTASSR